MKNNTNLLGINNKLFLAVLLFLLTSAFSYRKHEEPTTFKNKDSIQFLVLGDWGRRGEYHQKDVADQMGYYADSNLVDFVISTGDNFYIKGPRWIFDRKWKHSFEKIYTAKSLYIPWYTCFGNHDYLGNINAQLKYHKRSKRWKTKERYYSIQSKIPGSTDSVLFVYIDTNPFDSTLSKRTHSDLRKQDTTAQLKWLDNTLSKSKAKWKIVIGHHPLFSTGIRRGSMRDVRASILPYFEKHKVDAYFAGHEHDLQHQKPPGHTHYFVSGAGSSLRPVSSDPNQTKFAVSQNGFMVVNLFSRYLQLKVIDLKGSVLYEYEIKK